jgi:hypothetical protein
VFLIMGFHLVQEENGVCVAALNCEGSAHVFIIAVGLKQSASIVPA